MRTAVVTCLVVALHPCTAGSVPTVNLMTSGLLGDFEPEHWEGYACSFVDWATCVNQTNRCQALNPACGRCTSKRSGRNETIQCREAAGQLQFTFPPGGIFPVAEQFTIPRNVAILGAADPNQRLTQQQTDVPGQTWFVVPRANALCGTDPLCKDASAKGPTACSGDPRTHRQGFLMSTGSIIKNINFQGADLGRAGSEGTLCGPGAIELPGCLSGSGCERWDSSANGEGVVRDVTIANVRLSDAVQRADIGQMKNNCQSGEALDSGGKHVPAHQVSVWAAKLPASEKARHSNITIDNLFSMNSRADGLNIHGAVDGLVLKDSHIQNSGDDCIGIWSSGIENMLVQNVTAVDCAVTAGQQGNWGSCMGTYAFTSLHVNGLMCVDPFLQTAGCNPRTHFTAIHLNHAFDTECMPTGAELTLAGISYLASNGGGALMRPKCGQCRSCCGPCSYAGFDNLTIKLLDGSVTQECMSVSAGC